MDQERLLARGEFEELKDQHNASLLEIRSLIQELHRKMPVPDPDFRNISSLDTRAAQVLLDRIKELQTRINDLDSKIGKLAQKWNFPIH
ncbi:MAG: hypothetical protein AB1847_19665 [bacterium]